MDTLFTYQVKNPKYSSIKELKKTSTYLYIPHEGLSKQQMISNLKDVVLKPRVEINFQNTSYYISVNNYKCLKSVIKTYDDVYREVYVVNKSKTIVRYDKSTRKWDTKQPEFIMKDVKYLRNVMLYLDFRHVFMNSRYLTLLIDDVRTYTLLQYKEYLSLPNKLYKIL